MDAPDCAFPRGARLLTEDQFRQVFNQSERSSDKCFTVLARDNGGKPSRLGLAIAKKHLRRSVDRNRVKRITRESYRVIRGRAHGIDFVVLARNGTGRCENALLYASLIRHWQRLIAKVGHDSVSCVL